MPEDATDENVAATPAATNDVPVSRRRRVLVAAVKVLAAVVVIWLLAAYLILPALWRHYEHQPALEDAPKTTRTAQGIPGDPLNVGLIGTEEEVIKAMLGSGWDAADPITLRSSIRIASSVLRDRPYVDAPVSSLFVFGRKQDLAFEKPVGKSASHRHHVRFWNSRELGRDGKPLWIGAVTYDRSVGLSHRTGQITHHIGPDVDAERDALVRRSPQGRLADGAVPGHGRRGDRPGMERGRGSLLHGRRADHRRPRQGRVSRPDARPAREPRRRPGQGTTVVGDPPLAAIVARPRMNRRRFPGITTTGAAEAAPGRCPHSVLTNSGTTPRLALPSAHAIISGLFAASVQSRLGCGVMPTRPRSSRSASQQVRIVTSGCVRSCVCPAQARWRSRNAGSGRSNSRPRSSRAYSAARGP